MTKFKLLAGTALLLALSSPALAQQATIFGTTGGGSTSIAGGNGISIQAFDPCSSSCTIATTVTNNDQTGTSYPIDATDGGKIITGSNGSAIGYTLSQANQSGFTAGFGSTVANINAAGGQNITITATTSTFSNGATTMVVRPGQVFDFASNSTNYPFGALSLPLAANNSIMANNSGSSGYPFPVSTGTGILTWLGTPSSANLATAVTDETGTGALVFAGSPTFTGTLTASAITFTGTMTTNLTGGGTQCVQVNNSGVLSGTGSGCGGSGSPGGSDTQMQFNNAGSFGGLSQFTTTTGGVLTLSTAGAASTSAITFSGAPSTAGTTTTDFPLVSIWTAGATGPTTWSDNGTLLGINSASGFTGRFIDVHLNGAASAFYVDSGGTINAAGQLNLAINASTDVAISRNGSNRLLLATAGTQYLGGVLFSSNANGPQLTNSACTATSVACILPDRGDGDTYITKSGADALDLMAGNVNIFRVNATRVLLPTAATKMNWPQITPSSSSDTCTTGDIEADANYIYVCTASNTWKRATLSTF